MESPHNKIKSYLENQPTVYADLNDISLTISTESSPSVSFSGGSSSSYVLGPDSFKELYNTVEKLQSQILKKIHIPSTERIIITFNEQDVDFQIYYTLSPAEKAVINELLKTQHTQTISELETSAFSTMSFVNDSFRKQTRLTVKETDPESNLNAQSRDLPQHTTIPNTFRRLLKRRAEKHPPADILDSDFSFQYTYNTDVEQFYIDVSLEYPVFPNITFESIS